MLGGIALTLFCLWFSQNNHLLPVAASANAPSVDRLFNAMLTIALGLFVLVQGILIYVGIRFRKQPGDDTDGPPIRGNIPLEVLWTSIPAVLVLGIALYSFEIYSEMGGLDPMASGGTVVAHHHHGGTAIAAPMDGMDREADPMTAPELEGAIAYGVGAGPDALGAADVTINVMGLQFAWLFTYPDTDILSGELHVPVNQTVQLNIEAQDVLHAFWIPQFRLKQDAIPGQRTQLRFTPTSVGTYPIVCAELCGSYHGAMKATAVVESQEDYDAWMVEMLEDEDEDDEDWDEDEDWEEEALVPVDSMTLAAATVANPRTMSDREFLKPYGAELGLSSDNLHDLQSPSMN